MTAWSVSTDRDCAVLVHLASSDGGGRGSLPLCEMGVPSKTFRDSAKGTDSREAYGRAFFWCKSKPAVPDKTGR